MVTIVLRAFIRGGQIIAHLIRMGRQVFKIVFIVSLVFCGAFFCKKVAEEPLRDFVALYHLVRCHFSSDQVFYFKETTWKELSNQSSEPLYLALKSLKSRPQNGKKRAVQRKRALNLLNRRVTHLKQNIFYHLKAAGFVFAGTFLGIFFIFSVFGKQTKKKKQLSGNRVKTRRLPNWGAKGGLRIGKAVLKRAHETKHIFITGSTGSGKTNAIHHIMRQIRNRKGRAVIVDTTGDYVARYYNPETDYILNPFDRRSQGWTPWAEIFKKTDFKAVARCFVPIPEDKNNHDIFWKQSASTIFESLLQVTYEKKDLSLFQELLLTADIATLREELGKTKGAPLLSKEGEKLVHSIRAVLNTRTECLEHLFPTQNPFSITKWVEEEKPDSFLFLSTLEDQRDDLVPLLSAWFSLGIKALMGMGSDYERRLPFVNDEFGAMGEVTGAIKLLREGRRYGAMAILATQNPAQIDSIYGRTIAKDFLSNLRTKLVFAEEEHDIAKRLSGLFGEKEVLETQDGISYGAHQMRDGVSHSYQNRNRPVISATDIQKLSNNECFLKLCGEETVEKLKLNYVAGKAVAKPFEAKAGILDISAFKRKKETKNLRDIPAKIQETQRS